MNLKVSKKIIRENIEPVLLGVALAILIKTFLVQAYVIPSGSMMDTLLVGDCLLANKIAYTLKIPFTNKSLINIGAPERYDIIIFKYPKNRKINYIKRVIGLPGETLQIKNNKVFIDNVLIEENYTVFKKLSFIAVSENFGPVTIPDNNVFVMGDNRNNSSDSRNWGFVCVDEIAGKALAIYWSWDNNKKIPRLNRLFNLLS